MTIGTTVQMTSSTVLWVTREGVGLARALKRTITVNNSASPSYTLKVMTVVAVVLLPVIVAYQAWGYHVFKGRLSAPPVGGDDVRDDGVARDGASGDVATSGEQAVVPGSPVETP